MTCPSCKTGELTVIHESDDVGNRVSSCYCDLCSFSDTTGVN